MPDSLLDKALAPGLQARQQQHLYRRRRTLASAQGSQVQVDGRQLTGFCSNDYLGLANHPRIVEAMRSAAEHYGVGSGASHLVCGHTSEHHALEEELAEFTGRDRALLFSTGYMANVGTINALVGKGDAVFEDKLNHASLLDGGLLSGARFQRFLHNRVADLEKKLQRSEAERKLIVVDGVFSMDGDLAPMPELAELAERHGAWLMMDDAHGFGCLGDTGAGTAEHFGLDQNKLPVLMGTLGKGAGTYGAFVAGSEVLIETLIQQARPYIYTTAMPAAVAAATRASLKVIQEEGWRRQQLKGLIRHFRQGAGELGLTLMDSDTAIQPIVFGDARTTLEVAEGLEQKGYWVGAIRPPTVPQGSARLRVTLSAAHTQEQVDGLLQALDDVVTALPKTPL
ncbi:8-amino-7-oxononanoate synthase [Pseudomaricurvus alkylphenolicus]|jgi:8-amino-7-oxononanoate synthase|uniref:8-amino-7-oxononanoate synthase n=1 Tax=Pseudomaricurvus alkylphenolicus TaxID=1306991 RepID=UPI00141F84C1|nr:8-amino-7-oxononanoate synthase [Pseudomaricurvus alkylphenolicus]NIB39250.1 8-amino-7-oxononanoate synthase [Pseudomaricurvus alkylphenolicus]